MPRPRTAVLVGGPTWEARFGKAEASALVKSLNCLARRDRVSLLITTSPRTPAEVVVVLEREVEGLVISPRDYGAVHRELEREGIAGFLQAATSEERSLIGITLRERHEKEAIERIKTLFSVAPAPARIGALAVAHAV